MSRPHTRRVTRTVAEQIDVDKLHVFQQDDGLWRWRWIPASGSAQPLLASHGFESAEEAADSASEAYPQTTRLVVDRPRRPVVAEAGHAAGRGCGAVLATVAVAGLVLVRRRKLEHEGRLG